MRAGGALVVFLAPAALAACASAEHATVAEAPNVPGAVRLDALDCRDDLRDVWLTVYPTPRKAEYGDWMLPLDRATFVTERSADVDARLRAVGFELGWDSLPAEGYVIAVSADEGRTVVLSAAKDAAGRAWADLALRQISHATPAGHLVRACRILDAPVFPLRGNKRPQAWELGYRANFAWGAREHADFHGREVVAIAAPGSPLDATAGALERVLSDFHRWQGLGVQRFAVKFDDVGFGLTAESETWFGAYPAALCSYLARVAAGLRSRDPAAVLYWLPQTYWWNDRRLGAYATAVRAAGGLDPDIGLVMTGPEIISDTIDAGGLAAARNAFGLTRTPALIYDNLGREGDWGPLTGRDAALVHQCDGIFGERGTPVHRLTRLDWLWNPEGYDAERSWRRAVLELAGPEAYDRLAAACRAFRDGAPRADALALVARFEAALPAGWRGPIGHAELAALLRADVRRLPEPREPASRAADAHRSR